MRTINTRTIITLLLALTLLTACAAPAEEPQSPEAPAETLPEDAAPQEPDEAEAPDETEAPDEAGDHVLLTLEAPLADGRTLTLEAVGKVEGEYDCGVREVRVYDGEALLQAVQAREGNLAFWGADDLLPGESVSDYTSCWSPEGCMEAVDLNFDGNTDLGLFGFTANNLPPYYYWLWDAEAERYQYAFTLQGAEAHPEEGEISSEYKSGSAGSQWIVEYYKPDENHELYLDRVEITNWEESDTEDRAAHELWLPPEGAAPIRPGDPSLTIEADLTLVRRERPVKETQGDGTVSYFTEIWELAGGELQMTGREEFFYEEQPA